MNIVADESVDFGVILRLRAKGISVYSILEECAGITDEEVLKIATQNKSLLITEDKDFGELTYRLKVEHKGILLIRIGDMPRNERLSLLEELITIHYTELIDNFSVLDKRGIRIKKRNNRT